MESRDLRPNPTGTTSERRSRQIASELDWRDSEWPESGTYRDVFWKAKFGITLESLRELVHELDIPHIPVRRVLFVDAADMRAAFKKVRWSELKQSKQTSKSTLSRKRGQSDD